MTIYLPTGMCVDQRGVVVPWTNKTENQIILVLNDDGTVKWETRIATNSELSELD